MLQHTIRRSFTPPFDCGQHGHVYATVRMWVDAKRHVVVAVNRCTCCDHEYYWEPFYVTENGAYNYTRLVNGEPSP